MTAIESMKIELNKIHQAQAECVNDFGYVRSECRYRYQILTNQAKAFHDSIEWMQAQVYQREEV